MANNLALFVTHNLFFTEDQIKQLISGSSVKLIGHCVPVWVDAKTGRTTEPASEIFCEYLVHNSKEKSRDIKLSTKKGYEIFVPNDETWTPPSEVSLEELSTMTSEQRSDFMKERDAWWFSNPRPPHIENLKNGYLRFEIKKTRQKYKKKDYASQHVIEMANIRRLEESMAL